MQAESLRPLISAGRVIFGCGQLHKVVRRADRERLIRTAVDGGICELDVAPAYGNGTAERLLGEVLSRSRGSAVVNTKAGIPVTIYPSSQWMAFAVARGLDVLLGTHRRAYSRRDFVPARLERSLEQSLKRLRVESVGTFFLHEPLAPFEAAEWAEIAETMERLVRNGKARAWGIAGPPRRYIRHGAPIRGVGVLQLPANEVRAQDSHPESSRKIAYSVFSSYQSTERALSFAGYVEQLGRDHGDLSFVLATNNSQRLQGWLGARSP